MDNMQVKIKRCWQYKSLYISIKVIKNVNIKQLLVINYWVEKMKNIMAWLMIIIKITFFFSFVLDKNTLNH